MSTAMEIEANAFAMELLMPFDWIIRDAVGIDLTDEAAVAKLAKKYRVPAVTMAVRIGGLRAEVTARQALAAIRGEGL